MKKPYIIFSVFFIFLLVNVGLAGDRMILVEFFTSATCAPCASNNPIMTAFLNAQNPERITAIGYHMNWPSPGNDPMYLYNPTDNTTRRTYYGINSIPEARFDGLINVYPPYNQGTLQSYYNQRNPILSPVTIIVTDSSFSTDSMLVRAKIFCETMLSNPDVSVHIVLVENHIHYSYPPGTNGETDFYWVMRKMYPSGNGTPMTLNPGDVRTVEYRYKKDPIWNWSEMSTVVFVQDNSTREILNAAKKTQNFTLTSYPAFKSITQGQSASGTFKISVPNVAQGYNQTVTLSTTVVPSNAGITTSFPNGNTISNFPDSVTLVVNSTPSVPTGKYKVIVTGTDGNGKTHQTAIDYLVGKNYVSVRTNNSQLAFKVDNVQYISSKVFEWDLGSTHNLTAISPQTFGATRYVFQNWSNSGDTSQNITVTSNISSYIAYYKTQFRLLAYTNPSGLPVTITNGNAFYDSSTTVNVSVSPLQVQYNNHTYYFNRWVGGGNGSYTGYNPSFTVTLHNPINEICYYDTTNVGIAKIGTEIPEVYKLYQNYPNPFNPVTKINFDIPQSGFVKITVYNTLGQEIKILYNNFITAGRFAVEFNATELPSGIYFYRLETTSYTEVKKMILLK